MLFPSKYISKPVLEVYDAWCLKDFTRCIGSALQSSANIKARKLMFRRC